MERENLQRERREATRMALNGLNVLVSVPIVGVAASVFGGGWGDRVAVMTFMLAALYVVCGTVVGLGMIAGSLARRHTASVRLTALDNQLPAARVVVR